MKILLHLANGAQIGLSEFSLPLHAVAIYADMTALSNVYSQLTNANLSQISISQDGDTVQRWNNVMLEGFQVTCNSDHTLTAHFYFNGIAESTDNEDYVQAAKILLGEEE